MAIIDDAQNTLNTLFKNNVDYVGKQVEVLIDFLFPANKDNSQTVVQSDQIPIILTGQIDIGLGVAKIDGHWQSAHAIYNVYFNADSTDNALTLVGKSSSTSDAAWSRFSGGAEGMFLRCIDTNVEVEKKLSGGSPFSIMDSTLTNYISYSYGNSSTTRERNLFFQYNQPDGTQSLSTETASGNVNFLGGGKTFILTDKNTAQNVYNNYTNYNNDYHNSYTYNFNGGSSGGGGDVFVGGGAGGIAVGLAGGVCFNDIEFAINSLIDDLNLNFQNADNVIPFEFPSYYDLNYIDYGEFYIDPLHQYDELPAAPTFDGSIDMGDIPKVIGESANSYLGLLGGGLSTLLCGCFITALIVQKLGR